MRLEWSRDALDDLDEIFDYIASYSVERATEFVNKLRSEARELIDTPRLGTMIPEIGEDAFRELYTHEYNIMYEIKKDTILIHEVYNSKRIYIRSYNRNQRK